MIYLDLPTINAGGSVEQQLAEIRSYIYKSNEQMNATLGNLTIDKIWEQTASAVSVSDGGEDETPKLLNQYQRLRDLIIKTADVVVQTDEKMSAVFNGSYLAKSQFGEYLEKTKLTIDETSVGITELYEYHTDLQSEFSNYTSDFENYIKRGLLDNTGATPVYGIEVGLLSSSINVDGQSIPTGEKFRTRITPDEMSFWEGTTKVAYLSGEAIYFPAAGIKGGSININNKFKVSSTGVMEALEGTFSGSLSANSVMTAWNSVTGNKIKLTSNSLEIYNANEKSFSLSPQKVEFYKRDTVRDIDAPMGRLCCESFNGHWGLTTYLIEGFGDFYRLRSGTGSNQNANFAFTYIPGDVATGTGNNIYSGKGLYIETKLHVQQAGVGMVSSANDAEINIPNVSMVGGDSGGSSGSGTLHIKVNNGIITYLGVTQ